MPNIHFKLAAVLFCFLQVADAHQFIPPHRRAYNFQHIQPYEVANNYQLLKLTGAVFLDFVHFSERFS